MIDEDLPNDEGHLGNFEELVMLLLDHQEGYGCDHTDTKIVERLGNRYQGMTANAGCTSLRM